MTKLAATLTRSALIIALAGAGVPAAAQTSVAANASCTVRNASAAIAAPVGHANLSPLAQLQGLTGSALVRIELDHAGNVRNPAIVESTGSAVLDASALAAVRDQRYTPEIRDCESVPGTYMIGVDFGN